MTFKSRRLRVLWSLLLLFSVGVAACARTGESPRTEDREGPTITVGSADFSESQTLAEIYAQALEAEGFPVSRQLGIGARELYFAALVAGEISLVPEYVEAVFLHVTGSEPPGDPDDNERELRGALEAEGIVALEPAEAENRDGLAVRRDTADELGLEKMSDLAGKAQDMVLAAPEVCPERPACLPGFRDVYGLEFKEFRPLDTAGVRYAALVGGEVDVIRVFTTDGEIGARDLVVLEDDKGLSGDQRIIPALRRDVADAYGDDLVDVLNGVSAALTTEALVDMNRRTDVDHDDHADVARDWLRENGFLS